MAKSRSESSLRGAEGDEAISKDSSRGREECPARARAKYEILSTKS